MTLGEVVKAGACSQFTLNQVWYTGAKFIGVGAKKMEEVQAGARWGKPVHQARSAWCTGRKMPGASSGHRKHGFQTGP